jgi:hypothetical protein
MLLAGLGTAVPQATEKPDAGQQAPGPSAASKAAHIVNDKLVESANGEQYQVVGKIYNSSDKALADVVIVYRVWKGHYPNGYQLVDSAAGRVFARIKYLPPKQTVDFIATGMAPVWPSTQPDPIDAPEITAKFAEE